VVSILAQKLSRYWGGIHTSALGTVAAVKGLVAGPIRLVECGSQRAETDPNDGKEECADHDYVVRPIMDLSLISRIEVKRAIPWILIIEKDTIFTQRVEEMRQTLHDDCSLNELGGLLITVCNVSPSPPRFGDLTVILPGERNARFRDSQIGCKVIRTPSTIVSIRERSHAACLTTSDVKNTVLSFSRWR
jgi:hypothetical protein